MRVHRKHRLFKLDFSETRIRAAVACVVTLLLVAVGAILIYLQIIQVNRTHAEEHAARVLTFMDEINQETASAARETAELTGVECNDALENTLKTIAIKYPYVRALNILHNDVIQCSSFPKNKGQTLPLPSDKGDGVYLTNHDRISPDELIIYDVYHNDDKDVMVSVNGMFIEQIIQMMSDRHDLVIASKNKIFDFSHSGKEIENSAVLREYDFLRSTRNDLAIGYRTTLDVSPSLYFSLGWMLLIPLIISAAMMGILVYLLLGKYYSPRQHLLDAIANGAIYPVYQPIVDCRTRSIVGFEILARWKQADGSFISPEVFITFAEQEGLIVELTQSIMRQAAAEIQKISNQFQSLVHVGLNVSSVHFYRKEFIRDVLDFQSAVNNVNISVVLEITEREKLIVSAEIIKTIKTIKANGILIALDDFGTGHSNLAYFTEFRPDYVKIDKMFVSQIVSDTDLTLIDNIISFAHSMKLHIIAEGVENPQQVEYLTRKNVFFIQGYYYYKPLKFDALVRELIMKQLI